MQTIIRMAKSKTTWTGLGGICTAIGLYVGGQIGVPELASAILAALGLIFVRDTIATAGK